MASRNRTAHDIAAWLTGFADNDIPGSAPRARDWCEENLHWTVEQIDGKYAIEYGDDSHIVRRISDADLLVCSSEDIDLDQERH